MTFSLASVLALGLDGFIVCTGLGTLRFGWKSRRYLLATMCGITDAVATAAGAAYGMRVSWENLIPGIVAAWLLVVLLSGKRAWNAGVLPAHPVRAFYNLVAGASHGIRPSLTDIVVGGAVSAALAFAGLCLGAGLAPRVRRLLSASHHVVQAALTSRFGRG